MRRTSLTPEQAQALAAVLTARRTELGLSMRQVAAQTGFNIATISLLERATSLTPQPETLKAIARVLDLSVSDLYVVADWLPEGELPTVRPYMRAKYQELSEDAVAEVEAFVEALRAKHRLQSPTDDEDERT
jgi:transcriptional regulator with XRE-family HTH domain